MIDPMTDVRWAEIPGYPDYLVSNHGVVKRIIDAPGTRAGKILKPSKSVSGYLSVALYRNGRRQGFRLNRLVLIAFVGDRPLPMEASHLDGNRLNNRLDNLLWETTAENNARRKYHKTSVGARNGRSKLNDAAVAAIRSIYAKGGTTYTKLAKQFGVSFGAIGHIVKGRQWQHIGGDA